MANIGIVSFWFCDSAISISDFSLCQFGGSCHFRISFAGVVRLCYVVNLFCLFVGGGVILVVEPNESL